MKRRPQANFAGLEGSRGPSRIQSQAKTGASRMTKMGWTDSNQDDGNEKPEHGETRVAVGEQVERRSRLLVGAPEERREEEEDTTAPMRFQSSPVSGAAAPRPGSAAVAFGWAASRSRAGCEPLPPEHVLDEPERACPTPAAGEPEVPVDLLGEAAGDDGPDEGAEVDAHVEDREAGVAPRVARLVERAHQRADVGLQQAGADDDEARGPRRRTAAPGTRA